MFPDDFSLFAEPFFVAAAAGLMYGLIHLPRGFLPLLDNLPAVLFNRFTDHIGLRQAEQLRRFRKGLLGLAVEASSYHSVRCHVIQYVLHLCISQAFCRIGDRHEIMRFPYRLPVST